MTNAVIAHRYAAALVDILLAPGSSLAPETVRGELVSFADALKTSPELRSILANPSVSNPRKRAVVRRLVESLQLTGVSRNLIYVLTDRGRAYLLPLVIDQFDRLADKRLGFAGADVITALPMSAAQQAHLAEQLGAVSGKKIRMHVSVDPELIGGVKATIGSTMYDGSVRGRLVALGRKLTKV